MHVCVYSVHMYTIYIYIIHIISFCPDPFRPPCACWSFALEGEFPAQPRCLCSAFESAVADPRTHGPESPDSSSFQGNRPPFKKKPVEQVKLAMKRGYTWVYTIFRHPYEWIPETVRNLLWLHCYPCLNHGPRPVRVQQGISVCPTMRRDFEKIEDLRRVAVMVLRPCWVEKCEDSLAILWVFLHQKPGFHQWITDIDAYMATSKMLNLHHRMATIL